MSAGTVTPPPAPDIRKAEADFATVELMICGDVAVAFRFADEMSELASELPGVLRAAAGTAIILRDCMVRESLDPGVEHVLPAVVDGIQLMTTLAASMAEKIVRDEEAKRLREDHQA